MPTQNILINFSELNFQNNLIASPLEQFEVIPFIGIYLGAPILGLKGLNLVLTNLRFYTLLASTLVLRFHYLAKESTLVPSK
jgi:hypothetical protein